jgi:hypothetical protein
MPRPMTKEEHEQGFFICDCKKFAHIFRAELLRKLPDDYHGELCPECSQWLCSIEKLKAAGLIKG